MFAHLALMASLSATPTPLPVSLASPAAVSIASDREACAVQEHLPWCAAPSSSLQSDFRLEQVVAINAEYASRVHYQRRKDNVWRSSFDRMPEKGMWRADCADLTFTTLDALARAGFPADRMWRLIVIPDTRRPNPERPAVFHMVGVVEVGGEFYVVGDTNSLDRVYRLSQANFVPTMVSKVSEGRMWRRTVQKPAGT